MSVVSYLDLTLATLHCKYNPMTMMLLVFNLLEQRREALQPFDKITDIVRCPLDCNSEVIQLDETVSELPGNLADCDACVYCRE